MFDVHEDDDDDVVYGRRVIECARSAVIFASRALQDDGRPVRSVEAAYVGLHRRRRTHDRQLHDHQGHLSDCNFITRLLYRNSY